MPTSERFHEQVYTQQVFSQQETRALNQHVVFQRMFDNMEMLTSLNRFKNPFECIVSQIIYQQVAFAVARRSELKLYDTLNYIITPQRLLQLSDQDLKDVGITGSRQKYIRNFSHFVLEQVDFWSKVHELEEKEVAKKLLTIKGVGRWTVEMFMLFGLGKKDIFSSGDLIIIKGLKHLYQQEIDTTFFAQIKSSIQGFETLTSLNLWRYMEQGHYRNP